jgi:hypothetical protein
MASRTVLTLPIAYMIAFDRTFYQRVECRDTALRASRLLLNVPQSLSARCTGTPVRPRNDGVLISQGAFLRCRSYSTISEAFFRSPQRLSYLLRLFELRLFVSVHLHLRTRAAAPQPAQSGTTPDLVHEGYILHTAPCPRPTRCLKSLALISTCSENWSASSGPLHTRRSKSHGYDSHHSTNEQRSASTKKTNAWMAHNQHGGGCGGERQQHNQATVAWAWAFPGLLSKRSTLAGARMRCKASAPGTPTFRLSSPTILCLRAAATAIRGLLSTRRRCGAGRMVPRASFSVA